jgi:hypothetical protein
LRLGTEEIEMPDHCAFCKNPLRPLAAWRANDGLLYCNEFCADAADDTSKLVASRKFKLEERPDAA